MDGRQTGTTPSTALAPIEPRDFAEALALAQEVSKAALLPLALRGKPADVLVSILAGRELGLSPMQSLRGMHVIEGKPSMSADTMVALCVRRPDVCRYFQIIESTDKVATYETLRQGAPKPVSMTFTWAQAQRAGLTHKDNWRKYPEAMLRARCAAALARAVYPDLLAGVYDPDEIEAAPPRDVGPAAPPVRVATATVVTDAEVIADPPAGTPTMDVLEAIATAGNLPALDALVPPIQAMAEPAKSVAKAAWRAKQSALSAGADAGKAA